LAIVAVYCAAFLIGRNMGTDGVLICSALG